MAEKRPSLIRRAGPPLVLVIGSLACVDPDRDAGPDGPDPHGDGGPIESDSLAPGAWSGPTHLTDSPWVEVEVNEAPILEVGTLIVGGGPAGLAAAGRLEDAGLDYWLIDGADRTGGTAIYAGGLMTFAGTSSQEAEGVSDSGELLRAEWPEITGGDPDDPWVQLYAERSREVHDWLVERGMRFTLANVEESGASVQRVHVPEGAGIRLVEVLESAVDPERIWVETWAESLVLDEHAEVIGVWIEDELGEAWIRADTVLVATGGFLRNLDMVTWARPEIDPDAIWFSTGPYAVGAGHRMLEEVGAVWDNPDAVGLYAHGIADPNAPGEELVLGSLSPLARFNLAGERFTSESSVHAYRQAEDQLEQEEQVAWAVFDARMVDNLVLVDPILLDGDGPPPFVDELEASGQLLSAATLASLAESAGVDPAGLVQEIEDFNTTLSEAQMDPFWGGVPEMETIVEPPFYAIPIVPALAKAFGGIEVDSMGRVVDGSGEAIAHLYAAGELTGMAGGSLVDDGFFTGSLSAVILSGWVASESLIEER